MFITKNRVAIASGDTSAPIKKAIVGVARQNQAYDVLPHSMRKHPEKLSSLDTTGLSVVNLSPVSIILQQRFSFKASIVLTIVLISLTIMYFVCYSFTRLAHHCLRLSEEGSIWTPVGYSENK
jgi:hypothetical protein